MCQINFKFANTMYHYVAPTSTRTHGTDVNESELQMFSVSKKRSQFCKLVFDDLPNYPIHLACCCGHHLSVNRYRNECNRLANHDMSNLRPLALTAKSKIETPGVELADWL